MAVPKFQSFTEFWPYYALEHRLLVNRLFHFAGSTFALIALGSAIVTGNYWLLLLGPFVGYGPAWIGHFFVEHNKPASFHYPVWSFVADWKMYGLMLVGRMGAEVERCAANAPWLETAQTASAH